MKELYQVEVVVLTSIPSQQALVMCALLLFIGMYFTKQSSESIEQLCLLTPTWFILVLLTSLSPNLDLQMVLHDWEYSRVLNTCR